MEAKTHRKTGLKCVVGPEPVPSFRPGLCRLPTLICSCRSGLFTASIMKQGNKDKEEGGECPILLLLATWGLRVLTLGVGCLPGSSWLRLRFCMLRVEQDDVGLGYIQHAGDTDAQAQGHSQCRGLDVDLSHRGKDQVDSAQLSPTSAPTQPGSESISVQLNGNDRTIKESSGNKGLHGLTN